MADQFLMLVEGRDDEHVLYHLLEHHKVPDGFKIRDKKGIDNLLETLDVELIGSGLKRLGIVIDADVNIQGRWDALRSILVKSGYITVPTKPEAAGTIIEQVGLPVVGLWLMPDNALPGMLENFIAFLVPPGDGLWPLSEGCLQEAMALDCRFAVTHRPKALIHTWLAWQEEPGTPLGLAITKRYLDADAPHAQQLIAWIRRLFELPSPAG